MDMPRWGARRPERKFLPTMTSLLHRDIQPDPGVQPYQGPVVEIDIRVGSNPRVMHVPFHEAWTLGRYLREHQLLGLALHYSVRDVSNPAAGRCRQYYRPAMGARLVINRPEIGVMDHLQRTTNSPPKQELKEVPITRPVVQETQVKTTQDGAFDDVEQL